MKGSKEASSGGRKTVSIAITADGDLPGARAICLSHCLATGSQVFKTTKAALLPSFLAVVLNKESFQG